MAGDVSTIGVPDTSLSGREQRHPAGRHPASVRRRTLGGLRGVLDLHHARGFSGAFAGSGTLTSGKR